MMRMNDFKIGLVVVVALVLLLSLTFKVNKFSFSKSGYELDVAFINSSGIEKNAPVRLSGVEAGKVKDLTLFYDSAGTHVMLTLWLDNNAKVRRDSEALVTTLGLMGEKYVELTAGSPSSPFLEPGSTIIGREPFDTTKFMEKGEQIAENLDLAIISMRELSDGVNEVIVVHRQDLDAMLKNLVETSENIKAFSEDVKWHPWKLLRKSKSQKPKEEKTKSKKESKEKEGKDR
ncbi:MAG: MCE family protein [Candidatus Omnitrophica bacterium]|nr:MCE family protein [Candidatus Omnitrophota bacterium]